MSYNLTAGAHTDIGMRRDHNEDYYYRSDLDKGVAKEAGYLFVTADGVGGNRGGEEASRIACEQLPKHFFNPSQKGVPLAQRLADAINLTHHDIRAVAANDAFISEMSCTVVILAVVGDEAVTGHLGDARIYRYDAGELFQITKDHSWVQEQVDVGLLTAEQAAVHRNRNVVTRTLGGSHMHPPEIRPTPLVTGNRFLLCSDGLHGPVPHHDLTRWMQQDANLDHIAQELVNHANQNGGPDNIAAIVVQVGDRQKVAEPLEDTVPTAKIVTEKTVIIQKPVNLPASPPANGQRLANTQPEASAPPAVTQMQTTGRSGLSVAFWTITTIVVLAVCGLLAWLFFSGERFASETPPSNEPGQQQSAAIIVLPTVVGANETQADAPPTSTLAPEPTTTAIPDPIATTVVLTTSTAFIIEPTGETDSSAPPPAPPAQTVQPLILLDILCDGRNDFEPNAVINFKWLGKSSSDLQENEWMQIAIQSAGRQEGVSRQIIDRGANIFPEPTNGEWLVPRKLSSFKIVGDGNLSWWVEHIVDDTIVASSDTGCFQIVPKN